MTPNEFRQLALGLPGAVEGVHHAHPDFRVDGRIFATIAPDGLRAMVKLDPTQQPLYVAAEPEVYAPAAGAWGRGGATMVVLERARAASVRRALGAAHAFVSSATPKRKPPRKPRG
jgi:hypothetical protein